MEWSHIFSICTIYFCLVSVLSDAILAMLKRPKISVVINVCCYCCLILLFVLFLAQFALCLLICTLHKFTFRCGIKEIIFFL